MRHFASATDKPFRLETVTLFSQFGGSNSNSGFKTGNLKGFRILQSNAFCPDSRLNASTLSPENIWTEFGCSKKLGYNTNQRRMDEITRC
jgi:hypothetical protein